MTFDQFVSDFNGVLCQNGVFLKMSGMNDEKAEELIALVADYVELYDVQNKNYGNQHRKDLIWKEISLKLNETPEKCKAKWKNLRDCFLRASRSIKTQSGSNFTRKWRFYESMLFILPFIRNKNTHSDIPMELASEHIYMGWKDPVINETENETACDEIEPLTIEYDTDPSLLLSASVQTESRNMNKKRKREEDLENLFRELLDNMKMKRMQKSKNENTDPIEEFFICMAKTVKKFPPLLRNQVKRKVFDIVNTAEEMLFSESNPSTSSSTSHPNISRPTTSRHIVKTETTNIEGSQTTPSHSFQNNKIVI